MPELLHHFPNALSGCLSASEQGRHNVSIVAAFNWRQLMRNCPAVVRIRPLSPRRAIVYLDVRRTEAWKDWTPRDPAVAALAARAAEIGLHKGYVGMSEPERCVGNHGLAREAVVEGPRDLIAMRVRLKRNWRLLQRLTLSKGERAAVEE